MRAEIRGSARSRSIDGSVRRGFGDTELGMARPPALYKERRELEAERETWYRPPQGRDAGAEGGGLLAAWRGGGAGAPGAPLPGGDRRGLGPGRPRDPRPAYRIREVLQRRPPRAARGDAHPGASADPQPPQHERHLLGRGVPPGRPRIPLQ